MNPIDARYVLNIRPSIMQDTMDELSWSCSSNGDYNVKTGFHLQRQNSMARLQEELRHNGTSNEIKSCCSALWKLNLPPKLKNFWWRVTYDSLPVTSKLRRRGIQVDDTCQTFAEEVEMLNHMLFHCRVSKEIWSLTPTNCMIA